MHGMKDYISIKVSGVKIREWKQQLLCNFKEFYSHFKNSHPESKEAFQNLHHCIPETAL
jgi:hypothetical protein